MNSITKRLKDWLGWKQVALVVVVSIFSIFYIQWKASKAKIAREALAAVREAEITGEFEATVRPASQEFKEEISSASTYLRRDLDLAFDRISEQFAELCVNSDGYIERTKGVDEAQRKLADYMRVAVTESLNDSLEGFSERYSGSIQKLEQRLLVDTSINTAYLDVQKHKEVLIKQYSPNLDPNQIRGSVTLKTADEAFGWIPFVGDAYDLAKLALGDPREKAIKQRARACVTDQRRYWLKVVDDVIATLPTAEQAEKSCRERFSARLALKQLEAE